MEHRPVHVVLPSPVSGVPEVRPASGETAPEKRSPGTAFPLGWEMQFTGGKARQASLLQGKRGLTVPGQAGCQNV